jgi:hypothetical protein
MAGDLSHGLSRLSVGGNRLADSLTGAEIRLRGVVRSGLEYCSPGDNGSLVLCILNK